MSPITAEPAKTKALYEWRERETESDREVEKKTLHSNYWAALNEGLFIFSCQAGEFTSNKRSSADFELWSSRTTVIQTLSRNQGRAKAASAEKNSR